MIIDKIQKAVFFALLSLLLLLQGCDMYYNEGTEPEFKVFGDQDIIGDMVINVESFQNYPLHPGYITSKTQTQLYRGTQYIFKNNAVLGYHLFISYKNQVHTITFDNIYGGIDGHVNHIYVLKKKDEIYFQYYGIEPDSQKTINPSQKLTFVDLEDYFKENGITDKEEQTTYNKKFFSFFSPDIQKYKLGAVS